MSFSYMKSKLVLFDSYRTVRSNSTVFPHQGFDRNAMSKFKPQLSIISGSDKVKSMFRVMCFLGVKQLSTLNFHQFGRTIYNVNPYSIYIQLPRSVIPRGARWLMTTSQKCCGSPKGLFLGSLIFVTILFGRIQRIPYSKRFHLVLSDKIVKIHSKIAFKRFMIKNGYKIDKILPPTDPKCIRTGLITRDVVQAMHDGLRLDGEFNVIVNGSKVTDLSRDNTKYENSKIGSSFDAKKECRNEIVCKEIGQNGARKPLIWKPATRHLKKENWEVTVIDSYRNNAYSFPDGSIVVLGGMVDCFRSDASVAWTIGHEVGHAVSRHGAETLMRRTLLMLIVIHIVGILDLSIPAGVGWPILSLLLWRYILLWISRRRELEADYIGLLLMASARYDPREALKSFYPEFDTEDIRSTHPSHGKRVKMWNKAMEEALAVYNEVKSGCGVRSFI